MPKNHRLIIRKRLVRIFEVAMTFIFFAVFGLMKINVRAEDFSDMLGEQPDGTYGGMGVTDGEEYEVLGHWARTNILYFDPEIKEFSNGESTLIVSRPEEAEDFVFSYNDTSGNAVVSYRIDTNPFNDKYYPLKKDVGFNTEDLLWEDMYAYREPDGEDLIKDIRITYAITDMEISEDGKSYSLDNISFFEREDARFNGYPINEDYNASKKRIQSYNICNEFDAGQTDGQVRYIIVEVWDPSFEGSRMTNAYEYTWVEQPEIVGTEPIYGPIEYTPMDEPEGVTGPERAEESGKTENMPVESYADNTAGESIAILILFILIPAVVIVAIIVIIVKVVKRRKRN